MRNAKLVVAATPKSLLSLLGIDPKMRGGNLVIIQAQTGSVTIGTKAAQPYVLAVDQTLHLEGEGVHLKDIYIVGTAAILVL